MTEFKLFDVSLLHKFETPTIEPKRIVMFHVIPVSGSYNPKVRWAILGQRGDTWLELGVSEHNQAIPVYNADKYNGVKMVLTVPQEEDGSVHVYGKTY